jgi:hypothetical protein
VGLTRASISPATIDETRDEPLKQRLGHDRFVARKKIRAGRYATGPKSLGD